MLNQESKTSNSAYLSYDYYENNFETFYVSIYGTVIYTYYLLLCLQYFVKFLSH